MATNLSAWALSRISRLLPLDDESLKEIINYATSLSKAAGAEHLKNLLGDSPQALDFISSFNARREEVAPPQITSTPSQLPQAPESASVPRPGRKPPKKSKAPLHSAGPARRPEGYGDVSGAYTKSNQNDEYIPGANRGGPSATSLSEALSLTQEPAALQTSRFAQHIQTPSPTSSRDPSPPRKKLPPSASGNLISDLPNVKTKQSKKPAHSGSSTPHKATSTTTSSIGDLTSAIAALELSTNPSLSSEGRKCSCNASIHPLFKTAPNCLSCGKIICALEGLQLCSFCNSPILTKEQVNEMIRALKDERGHERMAAHNASASQSGKGTPIFGLGGNTPESSGDESSGAAARARAHRDKLLAFQRDNAQRTKIHDEASDYDMNMTPGATQWMSPVQRATALKKQQKYLREIEEQNKPEWERKKTVMSMSIKNGKLVKTFETVKSSAPQEAETEVDENDVAEDESSRTAGNGAFSNNPLLTGGRLIRPVWKSGDNGEKGKGRAEGERKSIWRRVQDDNDDNEQWILDGGERGYDDGSSKECG